MTFEQMSLKDKGIRTEWKPGGWNGSSKREDKIKIEGYKRMEVCSH